MVILLGMRPAYRLTRRWVRQQAVDSVDLVMVIGWETGMALLSLLLVVMLWRLAIDRTE